MPSQSAVRVINPVLTSVAHGYADPGFVGSSLFPRVPVNASGGQALQFGKESFQLYSLRRVPGAATKRVRFGYLGALFALLNDAVEVPVPDEDQRDASVVPGVDLATRAVNMGMKVVSRSLEYDQATMALTAANYAADHQTDLSGGGLHKWSTADGVPIKDIETAKEVIRASCGVRANTLVLSATAYAALKANPQIVERFKYTSSASITTAMLAASLEIPRVVVGDAIVASDAGVFSDIWGNNAVLAYVPLAPTSNEEPSYGYTYTMAGHPLVVNPYRDENSASWIYPVRFERAPVLTGIGAGYLIQNPA
jgi:hypothetical protein